MQLQLPTGKKLYFASDFHLGTPSYERSREREEKVVRFLEMARQDAAHIFLMGDLFDFWFEYGSVVPKGFLRFQGKLAQIADQGIPITIFPGNHDLWMFDYFEQELGASIVREPMELEVDGKRFLLGHGDGLGPGDRTYKWLKKVFTNRLAQILFRWLHPDLGVGFANAWSRRSRAQNAVHDEQFNGPEREWLWHYCQEQEQLGHRDYYLFGHRHLPLDLPVGEHSRYVNIGQWLSQYTYAVYDGQELQLCVFEEE